MDTETKPSMKSKIFGEMLEMVPPTLFFFVMLHVVVLVRSLMTRGTGVDLPVTGAVAIASLILGKSVLIANMMPFINRFPDKPLIWNVTWKTLLYTLIALFLHFCERLYDFWKGTHALAEAYHRLIADLNVAHFLAIQILLLTLIFGYCVFAELVRILGRQRVLRMFFGPMPDSKPHSD